MAVEIYKQKIIDRFQNPQYKREVEAFNREASQANALCGDRLNFQLRVSEGVIEEVGWSGEGCAICLAAADLLAEEVAHKPVDEVAKLEANDIFNLVGVELKPSREKCALLSLECLSKSLDD